MPIFVGTGDTSSRIRSNRVGFASHSANPGTASEGDVYFNSSDGGLRAYDGSAWSAVGAGGGTYSGIASGAISDGDPIIVGAGGTLGIISSTSFTQANGSQTVWHSVETYRTESVYHETEDKMIFIYQDGPDSNKGKITWATVNPNVTVSLTYQESTFLNAICMPLGAVYVPDEDVVVIAYVGDDPYHGKAVAFSLSGNTVTYGSHVTFNAAHTGSDGSVIYDSNSKKIVIAFEDQADSEKGKAIVGTVSGTSISFGSEVEFESGRVEVAVNLKTFDSTNNKIVIPYKDRDDSNKGKCVVGTVSGNSISFGSPVVFSSNEIYSPQGAVYDPDSGNIVIAYRDNVLDSGSGRGYIKVGTVSGDTMTFGDPVAYGANRTLYAGIDYDPDAQKFLVAHTDSTSSPYKGRYSVFTVSGQTPTMLTTDTQFDDGYASHINVVRNTTPKRTAIVYNDSSQFSRGSVVAFRHAFIDTNLTSTNFIGFADADYSDGATAKVQIVGSIDDAQTGLTTGSIHYVQRDGSLGVAASNPSVVAGIALTDTKILIRK